MSVQGESGLFVGIDIGGTKLAVAIAESREDAAAGRYRQLLKGPVPGDRRPATVIDYLDGLITRESAGVTVASIGIAIGGPLDHNRGVVENFPHLPEWRDLRLAAIIAARCGAPTSLDNDANLAGIAEYRIGGAERPDLPFVYLTLSTGIGGGIILDGELLHGLSSGAGELGHVTVDPTGPRCPCGNHGCLEQMASGTNIARRARARARAVGAEGAWLLRQVGGDLEKIRAEEVVAGVAAGDRLSREIWDDTIQYLAIGIGSIVHVVAPGEVRLGGGLSAAGDLLVAPLRRRLRAHVGYLPVDDIVVDVARLGHDSAVLGALLLASNQTTS